MAVATGVTFIMLIFTPWAIPVGAVGFLITGVGWFWPKSDEVPD
jgi:hypothetical protein